MSNFSNAYSWIQEYIGWCDQSNGDELKTEAPKISLLVDLILAIFRTAHPKAVFRFGSANSNQFWAITTSRIPLGHISSIIDGNDCNDWYNNSIGGIKTSHWTIMNETC